MNFGLVLGLLFKRSEPAKSNTHTPGPNLITRLSTVDIIDPLQTRFSSRIIATHSTSALCRRQRGSRPSSSPLVTGRPFARSLKVKAERLHSAFVHERPGYHSCYAGSHHARFGPLTDLTAVGIRVPTLPSVEIFCSAPITCRVLLLSLSRGVRRRISGVKDL